MIFIILLFLLPIAIAFIRGHKNAISITIINLFLGATIVGYFASLAWSFSSNTDPAKARFKKIKDWHLLTIFAVLFIALVGWYKFVFLKHHKPAESKGIFHIIISDIIKDVLQEEVGKTMENAIKPIRRIL